MKTIGSQLPNFLKKKASGLRELNLHLQVALPAEIHRHVQVAGLHHEILTVEVDSPVWASKIRYLANNLVKQLSTTTGLTIKSVKILIRPTACELNRITRKPLAISGTRAGQFKSLAKSIKHPGLKSALSKLAQRGGREN